MGHRQNKLLRSLKMQNNTPPKVCILGLGYIGFPTACVLGDVGLEVVGVDIKESHVNDINKGKIKVEEPFLQEIYERAHKQGRFIAKMTPEPADVFLIVVPTPFKKDHKADLSFIYKAIDSILPVLKEGDLIIIESTSPVGTTQEIKDHLQSRGFGGNRISLAYCPERVIPGNLVHELVENDRIVGGVTPAATKKAVHFYKNFVKGKLLETNSATAELAKLAENIFRDVNIALSNEMSMVCDELGIDVLELIHLCNHHPRVNYLSPGCGVGGHCIAVDPWFLISELPEKTSLIRKAREINLKKEEFVIGKVIAAAKEFKRTHGRDPIISCFGLAYKPDIDDLRESPALAIALRLFSQGYKVIANEPNVTEIKELTLFPTQEAVDNGDILVFLVAHHEYKFLKVPALSKCILDYCGILEKV